MPGETTGRWLDSHAVTSSLKQLLVRWVVLALGVTLATKVVHGISCDDGVTLLAVVALLSFFNAILKPLLVLFTLPFILVTMGLGIVVINALLFLLVAKLVEGFHVAGFWSAVWGSLVISITNLLISSFLRPSQPAARPPAKAKRDDVIDI